MLDKDNKPKLLHEHSVDELLKMLDSGSEVKQEELKNSKEEDEVQNTVIRFLIHYDIKPGKYKISVRTLLKLYKCWSKDRNIKYMEFWNAMNGQFQISRYKIDSNKISYISVNTSLAKITKHIEEYRPKKIKIRNTKNHLKYMEEFLSLNNIKPGPIFVESDILYYFFDYYNYKKKRKFINYYNFVSMCHLYFTSKQFGYGATWFGVSEEIKNLVTPEWVKVWRQGRVKYGYIIRQREEEEKNKLYTSEYKSEEYQKKKILYPESLPENKSKKSDEIPSTESAVQPSEQDGTS